MSATIDCPHCKGPARVRTSRAVTPTYRQLHLACLDTLCGHTFAGSIEILHTISPSACPDPAVHLRIAPPRRRAANDNRGLDVPLPLPLSAAANDDGDVDEALTI